VVTPKGELKRFERELLKGTWEEIRAGLEVQFVKRPAATETFILCRSADRAAKEQAMRQRFERPIEEGLSRSARACERQRHNAGLIKRRVGRLFGKNSRAARLFDVRVKPDASGRVGVTWSRKAMAVESAQRCEGGYLLRRNVTDCTAEELWKAHMQLTEAEAAFRVHKDDLRLRPIWHHKTERVEAHTWSVFWRTCCGRRWRAGRSERSWVGAWRPYWRSSTGSKARTSWCRQTTAAQYEFGAWFALPSSDDPAEPPRTGAPPTAPSPKRSR
jgi:hypothetical protein